jgi:hypothetical protein
MEKRAIVYSYNKRDNRSLGIHYDELRYSIDTLRTYNKDIPIHVYLSPSGILDETAELDISKLYDNINVHYFDGTNKNPEQWHPDFIAGEFWHCLYHRWRNAIDCLLDENIDCILFLDSDTVFYDDVELLFDRYHDRSIIYAKPDVYESNMIRKLIDLFNIYPGMNDGQFLLSKNIANKLSENLDIDQQRIIKYLLDYPDSENLPNKKWTSIQYSMYLLLKEKNITLSYFNDSDVTLGKEKFQLRKSQLKQYNNLILHHYFTSNREGNLPEEYSKKLK